MPSHQRGLIGSVQHVSTFTTAKTGDEKMAESNVQVNVSANVGNAISH